MWLEIAKEASESGDGGAGEIMERLKAGTLDAEPRSSAFRTVPRELVRLQQIIENPALIGGADDSAIMDDFEQKIMDSAA
jgi:hypothetical protein